MKVFSIPRSCGPAQLPTDPLGRVLPFLVRSAIGPSPFRCGRRKRRMRVVPFRPSLPALTRRCGGAEWQAWMAYYRRQWATVLVASVGLVLAGFGMS